MTKPFYRLLWIAPLAIVASLAAAAALTAERADWAADQLSMPFPPTSSEKQLIETLRSAAPEEKAIACKQLAIYGSKAAVPELAKLLADQQLASWSRIALEAIPDPAADAALIEATQTLDGQLLVGTINSIGARRSAEAVDELAERLKDEDQEVASAAAVALGRIGGDKAIHSLRISFADAPPTVRSAIAEGGILCAERLLAEGKHDAATRIYDEVRKADVPKQRVLEATRGAIVARGKQGIPLLLEQLKSSDKALFHIGLSSARELAGEEVAEALARQLADASPERASLIVVAIGDLGGAELPPAVLEAARDGDTQVRLAAIGVVGKLGGASSVDTLLEIATGADPEMSQAAKNALARLPGKEVNTEIVRRVTEAKGNTLAMLYETIGQRRIDANAHLVKAIITQSDGEVRSAALIALGATASPENLKVLISEAVDVKNAAGAEVAWQALEAASIRMPDREATAAELAAAMQRAPAAAKPRLLKILGAMGGAKALRTVAAAAESDDAALQDAGTRVLGEWMTADAAAPLYQIAASDHKYKTRALRGYLRIARQLNLPDGERLEMCRKALAIAERTDERTLALEAMKRCASVEAIELATSLLDDRELRRPAVETAIFIGEQIKSSNPAAAKAAGEKALEADAEGELADRARALTSP